MRAVDTGVILYGGYTGKFPEGKRGFTSVLMRRYSFAQLGEQDHQQLFRKGTRATQESLKGDWQMDVVTTSNHATRVGNLSFVESAGGKLAARFETISDPAVLVPSFVVEHFNAGDASKLERELRSVDAENDRGDVECPGPVVTRSCARASSARVSSKTRRVPASSADPQNTSRPSPPSTWRSKRIR